MCIGIPMQVRALEPGFAVCEGRGESRRVSTVLLGTVKPDEWLLVFLNDARERITAARAQQVNEALDLVAQAMSSQPLSREQRQSTESDLPSAMSVEQLNRLTGGG